MESIIVPIAGCAMIVLVVAAIVYGSIRGKQEMNETIRRAIDKGQVLNADLISALAKPTRTADQDLRGGLVLGCLAIGFIVAGFLDTGDGENFGGGFFVAAAITGSIGVGQLVSGIVRRPRKEP